MSTQLEHLEHVQLERPALAPRHGIARRRQQAPPWLYGLGELCAVATVGISQFGAGASTISRLAVAAVFAGSFVIASRAFRGGHRRGFRFGFPWSDVALGAASSALATSTAAFLVPALRVERGELAAAVVLAAAVAAVCKLLVASRAATQRILIVAGGSGTNELISALTNAPSSRFEIVGIVAERPLERLSPHVPHRRISDLAATVQELRPDLVVVAVDRGRPEVFGQLVEAAESGFSVVGLPEFFEHAFGRVPVRHLGPAWFMSVLHLYQRPYTRFAKRAFDVVIALVALLLVLPVLPAIALLVALSGRPIIFRQTRLGENGRHFTILKFRTMHQNAEKNGPVWASAGDLRVTVVGRVLRRTRLDELPQIWNVLRGDMSIVGPRPERPEFLPLLERAVPYWTSRHLLIKPGITGWAQISRGYSDDELGTIDKLSYDLWYLRHRSLFVDAMICLRTLPYFFTGEGAR